MPKGRKGKTDIPSTIERSDAHSQAIYTKTHDSAVETYGEGVRAQAAAVPNLEFKGFLPLDQVEPWFDRARVLVNTSTYEGMPNTFLQAWARGVPVAATVRAGVSLDFTDLDRLCSDEAYWRARSAESREWFEREHSAAAVAAHYERLFEDICT